jgi:uncharacterized protein
MNRMMTGYMSILLLLCLQTYTLKGQEIMLDTLYGSTTITEPVVLALLESNGMQRLKKINQYGFMAYVRPNSCYTRYEHSVGVFYLLRRFGASLDEQLAGLLHDVSHTVFSHVGDFIFTEREIESAYQDSIHEWFIKKIGIHSILASYGYEHVYTDTQKKCYKCLERSLPNVCADRLEYNLKGGLLESILSVDDIAYILDHIRYANEQWIFTDRKAARLFGDVSLYLSEQIWGSASDQFAYTIAGRMLKYALDTGFLSMEDIHFSTDAVVWARLHESDDPYIVQALVYLTAGDAAYTLGDDSQYDLYVRGKFRGVDPLVAVGEDIQVLSELDAEYAQEFQRVQDIVRAGWYINYLS